MFGHRVRGHSGRIRFLRCRINKPGYNWTKKKAFENNAKYENVKERE